MEVERQEVPELASEFKGLFCLLSLSRPQSESGDTACGVPGEQTLM